MSLFKNVKRTEDKGLPIVLADENAENYSEWNGLSFYDVSELLGDRLTKATKAIAGSEDNPFPVLMMDIDGKRLQINLSRKLDPAVLGTPDMFDLQFYVRNRYAKDQLDADGNPLPGQEGIPSGAKNIRIGKPNGISVREEVDLVAAVAEVIPG